MIFVGWEHTSLGRPWPMLEFFFDTTRAVVDWFSTALSPGTLKSSPHPARRGDAAMRSRSSKKSTAGVRFLAQRKK